MDRTDDIIVCNNPKSRFAESIKSIRTNLQFSSINKDIKVILNTSPSSGDGKSFVSANLAVAYAQEGKNVLIVDCDLRRGVQTKLFGVEKYCSKGYSHLILNYNDKIDIKKYLIKTHIDNVTLLNSGVYPPNPVELLSSENNKEIISKLRDMFDIIILDCAPVIGLNDALIMTKYSDANIVVVSNKNTKFEELNETKECFSKVSSSITGVVINKVPMGKKGYYNYYD